MKKNERGLKKRIARFFLRIGNKCKILSYPITFLMVAVLAVYHTIRKIFIETQYRKLRLGVLTTLCVAVVIGAVVVLPTLASEMEEALMTEVVTEEETTEIAEEAVAMFAAIGDETVSLDILVRICEVLRCDIGDIVEVVNQVSKPISSEN